MTYFKDLTHFEYFGSIHPYSDNYLNIGWLAKNYVFPTGSVSDKFLLNLEQLCKEPAQPRTLGLHYCELCPTPLQIRQSGGVFSEEQERKLGGKYGTGEIHVNGENGLIYAAPVLIYHYIKEHQYQPPMEFIKAVEAAI
jgi:hypothetical protein